MCVTYVVILYWDVSIIIIDCLNVVVTVGFERRVYSVEESSMIVEIGVIVIEGALSREVEVTIRSMDGTARSM